MGLSHRQPNFMYSRLQKFCNPLANIKHFRSFYSRLLSYYLCISRSQEFYEIAVYNILRQYYIPLWAIWTIPLLFHIIISLIIISSYPSPISLIKIVLISCKTLELGFKSVTVIHLNVHKDR